MNNRLPVMLVVALAVAGCSGEEAGADAPAASRAPVAVADAVAGVLQSGGTPIAKLAYVLAAKPVVGTQADLRLDLLSMSPVQDLQVQAEGSSITMDPATAQARVSLEAGKTLGHQLRFTAQREGLTRITVRLRSGTGPETVYDIPVLVADAAGG
jgi:hypothetical protein